jgi:phage tail-like protein
MWKSREKVEKGKVTEARLNGSVVMHDQDGTPIARWNFINAWPSKLTGPAANATNNEVGVEELEITHEQYERVQ